MKKLSKVRRLKKAMKNINTMTSEEIQTGVSDLYDAMLERALIKNEQKRKGFGYDISESRKRDSRGGADDGVRSEGEQSSEPGEPEGSGTP
ncbi:hypothetical protein SXBG_00099 [Synechococcus phage S-CAM1]|jgi:hypothetical protein|uniref:Uncharacterized protein n=1 Tax=Synechococcus phage S-CAM1 TaxID=754037 RepID=M4QRX7_9CAUD|nr:hypothetical protein SXBG_00099 [Synechococcus phage S-CAM1]AGH26835.1 hypothetical protein SXBG_00099 [Synechococcus phage S-CAM1]AOV57498.1 hypothetical protein N330309_246 [Synechococcus phage S-CAM1]AOV57748.1 hypothetical protein N170310_246 [Synechococcus phage S-CAM1]AOV57998.1 hypothetical protein C030809_246 [Synechococcus phage S-CAM1]AOV58248.1 hypothetical protein S170810_246 [Synechococcus phage S-CAM1]